MKKAKYAAGLNEFSYCGSLLISHPSLDPTEITTNLGMKPSQTSCVGNTHKIIPSRVYGSSHWSFELPSTDGDNIPTFLERVVSLLSPHQKYLEHLSDDGAEIECFIGIFADGLCDQGYSHELLASLSALRINLRFDFYSADDQKTDK